MMYLIYLLHVLHDQDKNWAYVRARFKVRKTAKIGKQYNQVQHLTQDTTCKRSFKCEFRKKRICNVNADFLSVSYQSNNTKLS